MATDPDVAPIAEATWPCPACEGSGLSEENHGGGLIETLGCQDCRGTGRVPLFETLPCGCWSHLVRIVGHHSPGCPEIDPTRAAEQELGQAIVAVNAAREVVLIGALAWLDAREAASTSGNSFAASAADERFMADVDLLRRAVAHKASRRG